MAAGSPADDSRHAAGVRERAASCWPPSGWRACKTRGKPISQPPRFHRASRNSSTNSHASSRSHHKTAKVELRAPSVSDGSRSAAGCGRHRTRLNVPTRSALLSIVRTGVRGLPVSDAGQRSRCVLRFRFPGSKRLGNRPVANARGSEGRSIPSPGHSSMSRQPGTEGRPSASPDPSPGESPRAALSFRAAADTIGRLSHQLLLPQLLLPTEEIARRWRRKRLYP